MTARARRSPTRAASRGGRVRVGISGYDYKPWRGQTDEFATLLREHDVGFVVADTAGTFPYAETVTSKFVYVHLHGSRQLYTSDYTDDELSGWAQRIQRWTDQGLDVYVYFDNDAKVHAPFDAVRLRKLFTNEE